MQKINIPIWLFIIIIGCFIIAGLFAYFNGRSSNNYKSEAERVGKELQSTGEEIARGKAIATGLTTSVNNLGNEYNRIREYAEKAEIDNRRLTDTNTEFKRINNELRENYNAIINSNFFASNYIGESGEITEDSRRIVQEIKKIINSGKN